MSIVIKPKALPIALLAQEINKAIDKTKGKYVSPFGFTGKYGLGLTPKELACSLSVSQKTLERLRFAGKGPPYIRVTHKIIRYPVLELDKWFASLKSPENTKKGD